MSATLSKVEVRRRIRGAYTPENEGKEEAYARLEKGDAPEDVWRDFKAQAITLIRRENEVAAERARIAALTRARQPVMANA